MSNLEDKRKQLEASKQFHEENADRIRFDANIPKTVVFPANWNELVKEEERTFTDGKTGDDKTVTYTVYQVFNPNSDDPTKLRTLSATESLNAEICSVLNDAIEQGWEGAVIANIVKEMKGQQFGKWKVRANKYEEGGAAS